MAKKVNYWKNMQSGATPITDKTDKLMDEVMREFDRRFSGIPVEFMANGSVTYSTEEVKEFVDKACRSYARKVILKLYTSEDGYAVMFEKMGKEVDRLTDKEQTGEKAQAPKA